MKHTFLNCGCLAALFQKPPLRLSLTRESNHQTIEQITDL